MVTTVRWAIDNNDSAEACIFNHLVKIYVEKVNFLKIIIPKGG